MNIDNLGKTVLIVMCIALVFVGSGLKKGIQERIKANDDLKMEYFNDGYDKGRQELFKEAIELGFMYWVIDEKTGVKNLIWNETLVKKEVSDEQ